MKYSVRFNLHQRNGNGDNTTPAYICLRVSWAGQRIETLTGIQIPAKYWDGLEQRAKSAYRHNGTTGRVRAMLAVAFGLGQATSRTFANSCKF